MAEGAPGGSENVEGNPNTDPGTNTDHENEPVSVSDATVLLVDDQPDLTDMYQEVLATRISNIRVANGAPRERRSDETEFKQKYQGRPGYEALDKVDGDVDVVFLDREMPDLSGTEVLEKMRNRGYGGKVVVLTGMDPEDNTEGNILEQGFDDYIQKAVSTDDLIDTVKAMLVRREQPEDVQDALAQASKREALRDEDRDLTSAWSSTEIDALLNIAEEEVTPAPGILGGWRSSTMVARAEREREFIDTELPPSVSLPAVFERAVNIAPERSALGYVGGRRRSLNGRIEMPADGDVATISYEELRPLVANLALAFNALNGNKGDPVAVLSGPRMEATLVELALLAAGRPVVFLNGDADPPVLQRRLNEVGIVGAVVDTESRLNALRSTLENVGVKWISCIDVVADLHADVNTIEELITKAEESPASAEEYRALVDAVNPDNPAAIEFESGTGIDGDPMVLSHRNIRTNADQMAARLGGSDRSPPSTLFGQSAAELQPQPVFDVGDAILTALTPASCVSRVIGHYLPIVTTATAWHCRSAELPDVVPEAAPDVVTAPADAVRDIFNRAAEKVTSDSRLAKRYWSKTGHATAYWDTADPDTIRRLRAWPAETSLWKPTRKRLGGNIRAAVLADERFDDDTRRRLYAAGIAPVETVASQRGGTIVAASAPDDIRDDVIGFPLASQQVKTGPVPTDVVPPEGGAAGELFVRGPNIPETAFATTDGGSAHVFTDQGALKTKINIQQRSDDSVAIDE